MSHKIASMLVIVLWINELCFTAIPGELASISRALSKDQYMQRIIFDPLIK